MLRFWKALAPCATVTLCLVAPIVQSAQVGAGPEARPAANRPGTAPPILSPEVATDRRVTFRLRAPDATAVQLNGEWAGGANLAMTKDASGIWSIVTGPIAPEAYFYSFSV